MVPRLPASGDPGDDHHPSTAVQAVPPRGGSSQMMSVVHGQHMCRMYLLQWSADQGRLILSTLTGLTGTDMVQLMATREGCRAVVSL